MIVLGLGDPRYHDYFEWLRRSYPDQVAVYIGFNNELANKMEVGADIFLMPSLFKPCGLNQIYSLRYATLRIVRLTGGLADTIKDGVNGFTFYTGEIQHANSRISWKSGTKIYAGQHSKTGFSLLHVST